MLREVFLSFLYLLLYFTCVFCFSFFFFFFGNARPILPSNPSSLCPQPLFPALPSSPCIPGQAALVSLVYVSARFGQSACDIPAVFVINGGCPALPWCVSHLPDPSSELRPWSQLVPAIPNIRGWLGIAAVPGVLSLSSCGTFRRRAECGCNTAKKKNKQVKLYPASVGLEHPPGLSIGDTSYSLLDP